MSSADGYSMDELLAIGTRKKGHGLNISAEDINRSISFAESQVAVGQLPGNSVDELKMINERKGNLPALASSEHINALPLTGVGGQGFDAIEETLTRIRNFLGINTQ